MKKIQESLMQPHRVCRTEILRLLSNAEAMLSESEANFEAALSENEANIERLLRARSFENIIEPAINLLRVYEYLNVEAGESINSAFQKLLAPEAPNTDAINNGLWAFLIAFEFGFDTLSRYFNFGSIPTLLSCEPEITPIFDERKRESPSLAQRSLKYADEVLHEPIAAYTRYLNAIHGLWQPSDSAWHIFESSILPLEGFYDEKSLHSFADLYRVGFIHYFSALTPHKQGAENQVSTECRYSLSYKLVLMSFMRWYLQSLKVHGYKVIEKYKNPMKALSRARTPLTGKQKKGSSKYTALAMCLIGDELSGETVGIEAEPICRKEYLPTVQCSNGTLDAVKWYVRALETDYDFVKDLVPASIRAKVPEAQIRSRYNRL